MSFTISHDCYSGTFRGFHQWRTCLGALIGVQMPQVAHRPEGLLVYESELPASMQAAPDDLLILLEHADDEGEIAPDDCRKLAARLEQLLPLVGVWEDHTQAFIDGLHRAADRGESVRFNIQ